MMVFCLLSFFSKHLDGFFPSSSETSIFPQVGSLSLFDLRARFDFL